ncbi:MAG: hypothetical protein JW795_17960 [Chitinivibrionales bacterium]|nr:hypothetical protein [Chitinivibrionales bacterium]
MTKFVLVCIVNGILFGILDGVIQGNPIAQRLFEVYQPIAKSSINVFAGMMIDLFYGFALGFLFLVLFKSLPGSTGIMKGISFGIMLWFLRVFMSVLSSWMMFTVPMKTLFYSAFGGFVEMMIIGIAYGFFVKRPKYK